jgi:hypothetical protein
MKEHAVQRQIVDALRLAGLTVYETTAYRQRGASGCDRGIPDLLVSMPQTAYLYIGIEVKRPGQIRWSSIEQRQAAEAKRFIVATSTESALEAVHDVLCGAGNHFYAGRVRAVLFALEAQESADA